MKLLLAKRVILYNYFIEWLNFKGGLRMTFERSVSKILEDGHVKSMMTPGGHACMKRLMTVDQAKAIGAPSFLTTPPRIQREAKLS